MSSPVAETAEMLAAQRKAIYRYILGMVRDPAEAEDLTQETLLRAHGKISSLEDPVREALGEGCSFSSDERGVEVCEPKPPPADR